MNTIWSSAIRDRAIEGLVMLACHDAWRTSSDWPTIAGTIQQALGDPEPLVRYAALGGFGAINAEVGPEAQVDALVSLMSSETNEHVQTRLLNRIFRLRVAAPAAVDNALQKFAAQRGTDTPSETEVELTTELALDSATPFATQQLRMWATDPSVTKLAVNAVHVTRNRLKPDVVPKIQERAFATLTVMADTAVAKIEGAANYQLAEKETEDLGTALNLIDSIAHEVYFASGADDASHDEPPAHTYMERERFAEFAVPLLLTCARTGAAPVLHTVVETLLYLAPLDERRVLLALGEAIKVGSGYSYDTMSGTLLVPYLKHLIAEHRNLVLVDPDGVTAFRHILTVFASAGSREALDLAFKFSDVFR